MDELWGSTHSFCFLAAKFLRSRLPLPVTLCQEKTEKGNDPDLRQKLEGKEGVVERRTPRPFSFLFSFFSDFGLAR